MKNSIAKRFGGWLLTLLALWLASGFLEDVQAHSSGPPRLADAKVGPYRVFVWMQPEPLRIGDAHISILVTAAVDGQATAQPVNDAQIKVRFIPLSQPDKVLVVATTPQAFLSDLYYEADVPLPASGTWRAIIDISGPSGKGNVQFDSEVLPARLLNWWLIGSAGALLIVLLGLIGAWSRLQQSPPTEARVTRRPRMESRS